MSPEPPPFVAPIMENVVRLADDAALLRNADRHASAFVLAVIHLEEIGKLIIRMWRHIGLNLAIREQRDHVSKQSAVFSLILAADLKENIISQLDGQTIDNVVIAQMAEQAASANAGIHLIAAQQRLMQQAKHAGLYVDDDDEDGAHEDMSVGRTFAAAQVDELLRQGLTALRAVSDPKALIIARAVHKVSRSVLSSRDARKAARGPARG